MVINMITFKLPENFILGTGSSAFQIEGSPYADGKGENTWDYSCRVYPEMFSDNAKTEPGSWFYKNYEQDIADMKELGLRSFRMSISWSRILPEGTGKINQKGIDFYNRVIDLLLANGIEPFVDIFHWDLPVMLADKGGFANREIIDNYLEFAKICFESFGDRVKYWSTFNEPGVFCTGPYEGRWYPFENDFEKAIVSCHNVIIAHYRTVKLCREMGLRGKIGAVIDIAATYPKDPSGMDMIAAQYQTERGALWWLDPMFFGKYPERILEDCPVYCDAMPEGYAEELKREFAPVDMIGINYYYPGVTEYREDLPSKSTHVASYYVQDDQRFDLYPAGLYDAMMFLTERYNRPEIYITENGLGVRDRGDYDRNINDDDRISYIREHLRMVVRSIRAGANIKGYYYWSNFDSMESRSGYQWRFGLNYVDFATGKRVKKKSWHYYQKIIRDNMVD